SAYYKPPYTRPRIACHWHHCLHTFPEPPQISYASLPSHRHKKDRHTHFSSLADLFPNHTIPTRQCHSKSVLTYIYPSQLHCAASRYARLDTHNRCNRPHFSTRRFLRSPIF